MRDNVRPRGARPYREYGNRGGAKGEYYGARKGTRVVKRPAIFASIVVLLGLSVPMPSPAQDQTPRDLSQASLEDLMNVQVTSVSKREQTLSRAGAAVFVLTQEDIRRSGATNLPDVLRFVRAWM